MDKIDQWTKELEKLKSVLEKANLDVTVKWGVEVYTYNGKNIVSYGGFKHFFTLWFYNGVFLEDKYDVLINAQEGKTKSLRQWRFTSIDEIDEKKILAYITEAILIAEKGLRVKPQKHQPVPVPWLLTEALNQDKDLNDAFKQLTSGKQKEYSIYIDEAKQEATKIGRVEKIKPLILRRIGLNDKYK
ncbi:YdeI/OmpD-associated family protein [Sphingobacterium pedocola]|uniref:YdhG-like domain-containing protein n=1 Tax=Sphingobacterium pedocola TaxID=2082722 RepID=A0ABR9T4I7_9SPHI|nr:DUF1801 domain-containing protein [Sphingobacterium pedocola]MBE8719572.1 hypothetical protein [Sphingobacterium pedocola]